MSETNSETSWFRTNANIVYLLFSYTMTLPSRFRKDLLRAAKQDKNGKIALNDMQKVIANISMEHRITEQEMETIFQEMGESGKIEADRLMKII
jgi:hypothetical protein